jgi:hypothetical protein
VYVELAAEGVTGWPPEEPVWLPIPPNSKLEVGGFCAAVGRFPSSKPDVLVVGLWVVLLPSSNWRGDAGEGV